jgi:hypothetical protein
MHNFSPTVNNINTGNINTGQIGGRNITGSDISGQHIGNTAVGSGAYAGAARDVRPLSNTDLYHGAAAVRTGWHAGGIYSAGWYARYPGAWHPAAWGAGYAWRPATWSAVGDWFGYAGQQPVYFDYGNNITYQGGDVYVNNQDVGSGQEYYQEAAGMVSTGSLAMPAMDDQWMPLGVFSATKTGNASANMTFQLAVDKQGVIRGNYTNTVTKETQPIQGYVDKTTQRAAWSVGDNTENVYETGIYNLTKDEAPMLVHFGPDKTEQWILVRMKEPSGGGGDAAPAAGTVDQPATPASGQP